MKYFNGIFDAFRVMESESSYLRGEITRYHFFVEDEHLWVCIDLIIDNKWVTIEYEHVNNDWYFYEEYRWDE